MNLFSINIVIVWTLETSNLGYFIARHEMYRIISSRVIHDLITCFYRTF